MTPLFVLNVVKDSGEQRRFECLNIAEVMDKLVVNTYKSSRATICLYPDASSPSHREILVFDLNGVYA